MNRWTLQNQLEHDYFEIHYYVRNKGDDNYLMKFSRNSILLKL